jgi:hypothetical protein
MWWIGGRSEEVGLYSHLFLRTKSLLLNWNLHLQYFYRYVRISNVYEV